MEPRWNNARPDAGPEDKKAKPNASYSGQGLEIKEKFLRFRSKEKNVLDIPSPKTLSSVNLRDLEAKFGGSFSE